MQKQDQVTVEDIFKRDHFSRLPHRWADQDVRFANLDYRDRRSIERACLNGYLYILIERQSEKVPLVAEAYYQLCSEIQRPCIVCLVKTPYSQNPYTHVIADLSPARTVIDHKYYSDLMHLLLSGSRSPYGKNQTWLAEHPILLDWFIVKDVPQSADSGLAAQLVEFITDHTIDDLAWLGELGAYESIINRPQMMITGDPKCPVWFERPLSQQAYERLNVAGWEPTRKAY